MSDACYYFDSPTHGALTYRVWPAAQPTSRASLIFLHGWGDHAGRYAELARLLAQRGVTCWAPDFAGHGRSPGARARVHDFDALCDDLHAFVQQVQPRAPLFLCGHSMGGCLAAHYALRHPAQLAGVIFNSAALGVSPRVSRLRRELSLRLGAVLPSLPLGQLKRPEHMARSAAAQDAYRADPLVHHGAIDAGTGRALSLALHWLAQNAQHFRHPFLALQGGADELVAPEAVHALRRAAPHDASVVMYPEARHDLQLELGVPVLADAIYAWLSARVEARSAREQNMERPKSAQPQAL
jgi:alpha-beta hydrolase superfamily lysophospholipase